MGTSPKVFISYAREDEPHAMRLYRNLKALGAEPWIDVTDMMVGVDWKYQIEKSLDECDYVVLLISNNYIDKTGYVQKEKRHIIDKFEHMPLGSLFLIPARLEDCEPRHQRIREVQRVDLFPSWEKGIEKIAKALKLSDNAIEKSKAERKAIKLEPGALSVKDYFEIVLPTMLRWKGEEATSLNKKVRFRVNDKDKPGESWTIHLVPPVATVVAEDESEADILIKITSDCMQAMISGNFNAQKAIANGDIELFGDLSILKSVGVLFQSG